MALEQLSFWYFRRFFFRYPLLFTLKQLLLCRIIWSSSQCLPNWCIFGSGKPRGVGILGRGGQEGYRGKQKGSVCKHQGAEVDGSWLGCAGFASKLFSLQSETRSVSHAFRTLTWKEIIFFSLHFASFRFEFFASNQSEITTPYFRFVSLP